MPHYQSVPAVSTEKAQPPPTQQLPQQKSSPKTSPYSSVDATNNYMNNNGQHQYQAPSPMQQQSNLMNNNASKYQQPPTTYNSNGNVAPRNNPVVQNASIPSGGLSSSQQMQQAIQQKYYDQYENFTRNGNGMSQSSYSSPQKTPAYAQQPPAPQQQPQMTTSYNQQMNYNNLYNQQHQNGVGKISDYDPITDGPRNVPATGRQNQTLIYNSSDRAASK